MKRFFVLALILVSVSLAPAQSNSKNKEIEQIALQVAEAYKAENFSRLDAARLVRGRVKIDVEYYDYGKQKSRSNYRSFRSFKEVERWFRKQTEKFGTSYGNVIFTGCQKGRCDFDTERGMLHNQFYLSVILYGYVGKRPFIKAIYFTEG